MTLKDSQRPRSHRSPLAMLSACALLAGSLTFALLPLAASANTGNVVATETCQTWSAEVNLTNNVDATHLVDVVVSPSFGHPGFTRLSPLFNRGLSSPLRHDRTVQEAASTSQPT